MTLGGCPLSIVVPLPERGFCDGKAIRGSGRPLSARKTPAPAGAKALVGNGLEFRERNQVKVRAPTILSQLSSYTEVYLVIYESWSVSEWSIFSVRGTLP